MRRPSALRIFDGRLVLDAALYPYLVSQQQVDTETAMESHEGEWLYVSGPSQGWGVEDPVRLYEQIASECESLGWHVVRPYREVDNVRADAEIPLVERLDQAVEHAAACILYVGRASSGVGAEAAFAYRSRRPILALQLEGDSPSPVLLSLLSSYDRARILTCRSVQDCAERVRETLRTEDFSKLICAAAAEHAEEV
jgi:hypothetical protein